MDTRKLTIIYTTDVHGNYFPYDFRHERWGKGSLQRVHGFVAQECKHNPVGIILIDGGDMIQGEPTSYYFNYVYDSKRHRVADMMNFIGYDVGVIGNHDIETGHEVFDKFVEDCNFPILGANAIDIETGFPYFEPYTIIKRSGIKIAVIGFITPAIPHWIPRDVWKDMRFEDIAESASKWVAHVKEVEEPDFIIGLFHSGMDEGISTEDYKENATRETATSVDGFDLILYGHDHASHIEEVESPSGKSVLCVNPGCYANTVAEVNVEFKVKPTGEVTSHSINCQLHYIGTLHNSQVSEFKKQFRYDFKKIHDYSSEKIGKFLAPVDVSDAYFGSSAYIDLIQELQLHVSGAELSFAAPLFFNANIQAGDVKVNNMFDLYRFEDHLYTLKLKGSEIKDYLEMSYDSWTNQMKTEDDNLLLMCPMKNNPTRLGFKNFIFNFDSAAGIRYEVDVRKPKGEKVNIISMEDGTPFDYDRFYTVAMTAYRSNGGGELLTKGVGLTKEEISERIITSTPKDVRYYLMEYIKQKKEIMPQPRNHWKFIPEDWVSKAAKRERELLFGKSAPTII